MLQVRIMITTASKQNGSELYEYLRTNTFKCAKFHRKKITRYNEMVLLTGWVEDIPVENQDDEEDWVRENVFLKSFPIVLVFAELYDVADLESISVTFLDIPEKIYCEVRYDSFMVQVNKHVSTYWPKTEQERKKYLEDYGKHTIYLVPFEP